MKKNILRISQPAATQGVKTTLLIASSTETERIFQQGDLSPCYTEMPAHLLCGEKPFCRVTV